MDQILTREQRIKDGDQTDPHKHSMPCLFWWPDFIYILANDMQGTAVQLQTLHSIAAKAGLLVNIGKTELITNIKNTPKICESVILSKSREPKL